MTDPLDFNQRLTTVLEKLEKPAWAAPLIRIVDHFEGVPPINEIGIDIEIINLLYTLVDAYKIDPSLPLETLCAIRFCRLLNFTTRAYHARAGQHVFWNPLEQSFSSFQNEETRLSQSGDSNPPEDIIKRWARDNLV